MGLIGKLVNINSHRFVESALFLTGITILCNNFHSDCGDCLPIWLQYNLHPCEKAAPQKGYFPTIGADVVAFMTYAC